MAIDLRRIKAFIAIITLIILPQFLFGQLHIKHPKDFEEISMHEHAFYFEAGHEDLSISDIVHLPISAFKPFPDEVNDFGFTDKNYWVRFGLVNETDEKLIYFIETSRPITDYVNLFIFQNDSLIQALKTGDLIPYNERAFAHRKSIFKVELQPKTQYTYYIHQKSDGEVINGAVYLRTDENLHVESAFEQIVFGFFYGILLITTVIYLFFYFAMREQSFLYYSLYVIFIGLLQFSLDGYFFQFFTPNGGWLSQHAVILTATIANIFLGRYAQVFLKINQFSKNMSMGFYTLYALNGLLLICLITIPQTLYYSYPIANVLGLFVLGLIFTSLIVIYKKTGNVDLFFATGIFFLVAGFVVFILKNFSVLPVSFWTENSSKLGTGLEVIFLSLSMANLIKRLRDEREELNEIALQKSEEMNELKTYFLSNISHELRTPLNAILSISDALKTDNSDVETQKKSEIIKYSAIGLLNSVNDILDFSKIQKNELQLQNSEFDLKTSLQQVLSHAEHQARDKKLDFEVIYKTEIPEKCHADESRLTQILQNVLSNALKFTENGFIRCEFEVLENKENDLNFLITITDSGIGITKEKMKSIYDSFTQHSIDNKRKFGGLGLGLYIVKSLVDLFQGKIEMHSHPNEGTVCKISVPIEFTSVQSSVQVETVSATYDLKGKRILVVEDNAINQMVIKLITKNWLNTVVEFANNGLEGLQALKKESFDLILMDLQMPVMDGYEATIAIRNGDAGVEKSNIPIIAVTADVMETTKSRVKEIGMNMYMTKPVNKDVLYKNVSQLVFA